MTTTTCPGTPTPALPTVYACTDCGERTTERRCPDCNLFTTKLGPGGTCPSCDELITLADLAESNINNQPQQRSYTENLTGSRRSSSTTPTPPWGSGCRTSAAPPGRTCADA